MSNQVDQEKLQAETIPSEEVRQFLLSELETRKQELVELSEEQLEEIAGGLDAEDKQAIKSLVCTLCGGVGAAVGGVVGHHFGGTPAGVTAMGPGFLVGHGVAHNVMNKIFPNSTPQNQTGHQETEITPLRDLEAGPSHRYHA